MPIATKSPCRLRSHPRPLRATPLVALGLVLSLGFGPPVAASPSDGDVLRALEESVVSEIRQMDNAIETYRVARRLEDEALQSLAELSREMDEALGDPRTNRRDFDRIESVTDAARQRVFDLTEASAVAARDTLAALESFDSALAAVESEGIELVVAGVGVTGTWRIQIPSLGVFGILSLQQKRNGVAGSYRLSNGARGSVSGRFTGNQLELRLVDSEHGPVGTAGGELTEDGRLEGEWLRLDLTSGKPTAGDWTADLLTLNSLDP